MPVKHNRDINLGVSRVPEEEKIKNKAGAIFEEIMAETILK
jgi:hypothetical protein